MRLCKIGLLLCIFAGVFFSVEVRGTESHAETQFKMGYAMKTLYDVDMKDAHTAFTMWSKEVGAKTGYTVSLTMFDCFEELMDAFKKGEIDFAIVKSTDLSLVDKGEIDREHLVTNVRSGKKGHVYMFMVHKDSPLDHIEAMKGKKLTVVKSDSLGRIFLDTLLLKKGLSESDAFFHSIEEKVKVSQVLLSVFFKQSDACLIPDVTYKTMVELNPQIKQRLRTIAKSDNLLAGVGFFRKNFSENRKDEVFKRIVTLHTTPRGKQILLLFKSEAFAKVADNELLSLKKLKDDYARFTNQRGNSTVAKIN